MQVFKNRREFGKSLLGVGMMLGLATKAKASGNSDFNVVGYPTPGCTPPPPPPPDTRTPEEVVKEFTESQYKSILACTEDCNWRRYVQFTDRRTFDRLMTMDLPVTNIDGQDYIIRNGWPITVYR